MSSFDQTKQSLFIALQILLTFSIWSVLYVVERHQTALLLALYGTSFFLYGLLVYHKWNTHFSRFDWIWLIITAVGLMPVFPNLSDDFYRFIWDGQMIAGGHHPFLYLPADIAEDGLFEAFGIDSELYKNLNSPNYYTVYPPILQALFYLSAVLSESNWFIQMLFLKLPLFIATMLSAFCLIKLLKSQGRPTGRIMIYIASPLVLIESIGNIHHEGLQAALIIMSIYYMVNKRIVNSGICLGLAIAAKLTPLLLLPLIVKHLGWSKGKVFFWTVSITLIVCFLPMLQYDVLNHMVESLGLYFQSFEFNASIYYIIRWVGYAYKGYNWIAVIGPSLIGLWVIIYAFIWLKMEKDSLGSLFSSVIWAYASYYFLSTTIHPWYLVTPLLFVVFTRAWWLAVWSIVVILSYSAYQKNGVQDIHFLIYFEYTIVLLMILFHKKIRSFVRDDYTLRS